MNPDKIRAEAKELFRSGDYAGAASKYTVGIDRWDKAIVGRTARTHTLPSLAHARDRMGSVYASVRPSATARSPQRHALSSRGCGDTPNRTAHDLVHSLGGLVCVHAHAPVDCSGRLSQDDQVTFLNNRGTCYIQMVLSYTPSPNIPPSLRPHLPQPIYSSPNPSTLEMPFHASDHRLTRSQKEEKRALADLDAVLAIDFYNAKARLRRGITLENIEKYSKAYDGNPSIHAHHAPTLCIYVFL